MRLKLYRAPRMAEAMAQVRAELGEDALILSTRRVADGVEITGRVGQRPVCGIQPLIGVALRVVIAADAEG
jgi:flagellar biosynthesis protein FlhF